MFYSTQPHYCPSCPPKRFIKGEPIGEELELEEENYHGYGVSIVRCELCKQLFQISYKVDQITKIDWS